MEQDPEEKKNKEQLAATLGGLVGFSGKKPSKEVIETLKKDKDQMEAFLAAATKGQIEANDKPGE